MRIFEKIKKSFAEIREKYSQARISGQRLFIVESLLAAALLIALLRLAHMQVFPHSAYNRFYLDNFESEPFYAQNKGTISDRNGLLLVADDFRADIKISTSALEMSEERGFKAGAGVYALSYSQRKKCARIDKKHGEKNFEPAGFSFKGGFSSQQNYKPDCNILEQENADNRMIFINSFMEEHPSVFSEKRHKPASDGSYYKNLDISEFEQLQQELGKIREIRDLINGFKFDFPTGTLQNICRRAKMSDIKNISVGSIKIPDSEKAALTNDELREYESSNNMPLDEYCIQNKNSFNENIRIGLILSEVYEKNRFSPQILQKLESELSEEDKKSLSDLDKKILEERKEHKYYCSNGYESLLCRRLYEHNLDRISEFIYENKAHFANVGEISKKLQASKKIFPQSKEKIPTDINEQLRGKLSSISWGVSDFIGYVISVLKLQEDYQRKIYFKKENGNNYLIINKKKARIPGYSDKARKLSGTALAKAKDNIYRNFAFEINQLWTGAGQKALLNIAEQDYVALASLKPEIFHKILPEVRYLGGTYFLDGLEFEKNEHARSVLPGSSFYSEPIPSQAETNPEDLILAQLLGLGENAGAGIEKKYADALASRDRSGIENIQLTIDLRLQNLAEIMLRRRGDEIGAERGFAIVQKTDTGEIIAAASYNPEWKPGFAVEMLNFIYQPGSTFKPFTVAFALESGLVKPNASYDLKSLYARAKKSSDRKAAKAWNKISDDHALQDGQYTLKDIIAASSNIGTSYIAWQLWDKSVSINKGEWKKGQDYMKYMRSAFGLGTKTGLGEELGSKESPGNLVPWGSKPNDPANLTDYLKDAYGQGPIDLTPIQLITAYSALLNGGMLYKPQLIRSIKYRSGKTDEMQPVIRTAGLLSPETLSLVKDYLKAVFEIRKSPGLKQPLRGTGAGYAIKGFEWGGKTGTADKLINGQKMLAACPPSSKEKSCNPNRASFVGFLPYENPEYVILVMFDESEKAAKEKGLHPSGAAAAGPVLKRLAEEIISIEGYSVAGTGGPEKSGAEKASGSENLSALGSTKKAGEK